MLPVREDNARKSHLVFSLHRIADNDERIGSRLAVWNDIIGFVEIALVDVLRRNEVIDFDSMGALES